MDNLIADGKIEPFIIVMTYGMTNEGFRPGQMPAAPARPAAKPGEAPAKPAAAPARPELFGYYGLLSGGVYTPEELKGIKDVKVSS